MYMIKYTRTPRACASIVGAVVPLCPSCACLPPPPLAAAANFEFNGEPIDQQIGLQREARNRGCAHG